MSRVDSSDNPRAAVSPSDRGPLIQLACASTHRSATSELRIEAIELLSRDRIRGDSSFQALLLVRGRPQWCCTQSCRRSGLEKARMASTLSSCRVCGWNHLRSCELWLRMSEMSTLPTFATDSKGASLPH